MHLRPALTPCALSFVLSLSAAAQSTLGQVEASSTYQYLGASLTRYFDVDGDGHFDYLAGQPGLPFPSNEDGKVLVLSGRYLTLGAGPKILKTIDYTGGGNAGTSLASVGDMDGDGIKDFLAGLPSVSVDPTGSARFGRLELRNAVDGTKRWIDGEGTDRLGTSLVLFNDLNGDGVLDVLAGSPGHNTANPTQFKVGRAHIFSGAHLVANQRVVLREHVGDQAQGEFGSSLCVGRFDGDALFEYAIGAPYRDSSSGGANGGRVYVYRGSNGSLLRQIGGSTGARFGASLASVGDLTGDGVADLVVGAPGSSVNGAESGSVYVYSGSLIASTGLLLPSLVLHGKYAGEHFGHSVAVVDDINGDGAWDLLVGSPDYEVPVFGNGNGRVTCYSGATGELLAQSIGAAKEHRGGNLAAAYNVDGLPGNEFLVGSPRADNAFVSAGRVSLMSFYPVSALLYCTAKQNSLGCLTTIASTGTPSATSAGAFRVRAVNALNNVPGILFYGLDANAMPFQGGYLCAAAPITRTAGQSSKGSPPPAHDCSGTFDFDFQAQIQGGSDPALSVGRQVFCQYWSRDAASPSTTNLTNGLSFVINP